MYSLLWSAIAILANLCCLWVLYESIGWHDFRGYREVLNGIVIAPVCLLAAANLMLAGVVAYQASQSKSRRASGIAASFLINAIVSALAVFLAPTVGRFLNHRLLLHTPMIEAARYGDHIRVIRMLERGDNPNVRHASLDTTPLHYMAARGHASAVQSLLEHGADPNAQAPPSMETPLHFACRHSADATTIQLLLEHGADAKAKDWEGRDPPSHLKLNDPALTKFFPKRPQAVAESALETQ